MHRGAMNRVRSEEAALRRSPECRGKPGPFAPWAQRGRAYQRSACAFGLALRIGTGVRSQWVPAPQSPPGSAPRPTQVAHMVSPALCSNDGAQRGRAYHRLACALGLASRGPSWSAPLRATPAARWHSASCLGLANQHGRTRISFSFSISEFAQRILSLRDTRCIAGTPYRCCVSAGPGNRRGCPGG